MTTTARPRIPVEVIDAIRVRLAEEFGCVSIDDIAAVDISDVVLDVLTEQVNAEHVDAMHDRIVPHLLRGRHQPWCGTPCTRPEHAG